jgi:Fe-S cluster assembly iron-binding protein IscA
MEITEAAKIKVAEQIKANKEIMPDKTFFLRVTAKIDADDKLKQQIYFDYEIRENDRLLRFKDFDLRIDEDSYIYLKHAKLEYYDDEENKTGFFIDNPDSHDHSVQNVI